MEHPWDNDVGTKPKVVLPIAVDEKKQTAPADDATAEAEC